MAQPPPRERTLREMDAPDFTHESLCIQYPDEDVAYVLKTGLIHLLPKFHGLAGEDTHKHLKEFHIVYSRTTAIRKDISGIRQLSGESLYEYWERFKKLCASCPHHQISE